MIKRTTFLETKKGGIHFKYEGKNNSHRDHRGFFLCVLCALCGR